MNKQTGKPVILVTRPTADAAALLPELEARGLEVLLEPMLEINHLDGEAPDLDDVQAILFTSANGVRAYSARGGLATLPAYAVGDATAEAAKSLGFRAVESADGNVEDLIKLVAARCDSRKGTLLHAAGSKLAGALGQELAKAGFAYRREELYSAEKAKTLSRHCSEALEAEKISFALFYSPRTAESFATLATVEGVASKVDMVTAFCLSDAVASVLGDLSWRRLVVAPMPVQSALLAALDEQMECMR